METGQPGGARTHVLGDAARRHLRLVLGLGLATMLLGGLAAQLLPKEYSSTAKILVTPLEGNAYSTEGRGDDLVMLETEAQLVRSDEVTQLAAGAGASTGDPATLRSRVSVLIPPNTQILEITFSAADPAAAQRGARAFSDAYLDFRRQRAQQVIDDRVAKLQDQISKVEAAQQKAIQRRDSSSGSARALAVEAIERHNGTLAVLNEQANNAAATPINPGQVITPAPPGNSVAPGITVLAGAGLVAGLGLGLLLAFVRERADHRLRDPGAVEEIGTQVLSVIPPLPDDGAGLVIVTAPKQAAGEAYRRLRAAVVATVPKTPVTLLVANATGTGTAALTSANLAVALARAGTATILVDADTSETNPSMLFGLRHSRGLSNVLIHGSDPTPLLVYAEPHLRLLPRGGEPDEAAERFIGPRMRETVDSLRAKSDFVVLSASCVHDADGQALCTVADAVLLVVTLGVTTRDDIEQAYVEIERAGAVLIGTVVEDHRRRRGSRRAAPAPAPAPAKRSHAIEGAGVRRDERDRALPPGADEDDLIDSADPGIRAGLNGGRRDSAGSYELTGARPGRESEADLDPDLDPGHDPRHDPRHEAGLEPGLDPGLDYDGDYDGEYAEPDDEPRARGRGQSSARYAPDYDSDYAAERDDVDEEIGRRVGESAAGHALPDGEGDDRPDPAGSASGAGRRTGRPAR